MSDSTKFRLNEKEQQFVDLYDGDGPATAKKVGFKNPTSDSIKLLGKAAIKTAIRQTHGKNYKQILTRDGREKYYAKIAVGEIKEVTVQGGKPYEVPAAMANRLKALDALARMNGDFVDRVEVGVSLEDELMSLSMKQIKDRIKQLEDAGIHELVEQGKEWIPDFEVEERQELDDESGTGPQED